MIILCDFDGTITLKDVTVAILDHFTGHEWREQMKTYRAGELHHFEHMQKLYQRLRQPEEELLDYARQVTKIRASFEQFVQHCEERGWPFVVVSGGVDFYLKAFLPENIPFYCYLGEFEAGEWELSLPPSPKVDIASGQDFKVQVIEELKQQNPGKTVVFIGDGKNDLEAAQEASYVFSVKGSWLSGLCREKNVPHTEFTDFAEITAALEEIARLETEARSR